MDFIPVLIVIAGDPDTLPGAATKINTNLGTLAQLLAAMDHDTDLLHAGTNTHEAIDAFIASKAAANGLCDLDANLLVPTNRLPALAINETFVVASQVEMLALDCQKGDVALRSDGDTAFILAGEDPSILANWKGWLYPASAVVSVDGRVGVVTLSDLYLALANVTATPTASKTPISDTGGKLDGWISDADATIKGKIQLAGHLGGTAASPTVTAVAAGVAFPGKAIIDEIATPDAPAANKVAFYAKGGGLYFRPSGGAETPLVNERDVVGGRLDLVSATSLQWTFLNNNQIVLFDGTGWTLVPVSSMPTLANTAVDMNGDALAVDTIYDLWAKRASATSFTLEAAKWAVSTAGSSVRYSTWAGSTAYKIGQRVLNGSNYYACMVAHTSGTFATDLAAGKWVNNGTDPGADFKGLYRADGRWVYGSSATAKQYRWLGVIYTYNNSATVNFKDHIGYRYISSYYNSKIISIEAHSGDAGTYNLTATSPGQEMGTAVRGNFVSCITQPIIASLCTLVVAPTSAGISELAYLGSGATSPNYQSTFTTASNLVGTSSLSSPAGFNYLSRKEYVTAGTGVVYSYSGAYDSTIGVLKG